MAKKLSNLSVNLISIVSSDKKPAVAEAECMVFKIAKQQYWTNEQIQKLDKIYKMFTEEGPSDKPSIKEGKKMNS